jgi:lipopolysaccharide assembly outer membrane protein LptD (OstA)
LFLQVSKISSALFILLLALFQQFTVGSPVSSAVLAYTSPDSIPPVADSLVITADTLITDTAAADTNASGSQVLKSEIKYTAVDSIRVGIEDEIVNLYGKATVDYEDLHLEADHIMIDMNSKIIFAEGMPDSNGIVRGKPEFSQAAQKFRSNTIRYNFDTKKGKISYVITQEGDGFIHGEVVKKDPENNFFIRNGQYTTCNLDTPHYAITSNRLKVISNNKIITGPAYLTIEQVPTPLLIPFGFFPNKKGRSSGIIFPSFGESAQRGFYFQNLGYYFGFSDYFNLSFTSDIYTKGSYALHTSSDYVKRYRYSGKLLLSYSRTITSEKELPDYQNNRDFFVDWTHSRNPKASPNSTFSATVHAGTSTYFRNTISSVPNFLSNTFNSSIAYTYRIPDKPFNFGISMRHTQNTLTRDFTLTAPQFNFNMNRITLKRKNSVGLPKWYEKIGISYALDARNFLQTKDSLLFTKDTPDKFQYGAQHSIPVSTSFTFLKFYNISPSVNYTERWYFKTTRITWNPETRKTDTTIVREFAQARDYSTAVGLSTKIFGMFQIKRGPVVAVRHVMTPSASFSFRPDFGDPGYGYYKKVQTDTAQRVVAYSIFQNNTNLYGTPANGRSAVLNFGLDNNLEMKVRTNSDTGETVKKIKLLESLRIGAGYNIIADSMKWSNLNLSAHTTLLDRISVTFSSVLDPYAFDQNNNDYDKFLYRQDGRLFRMTSASLSMNFALNNRKDKSSTKYSQEEMDYINRHPEEYVDFNIPYNVNVSYSYDYGKRGDLPSETHQSAGLNGDLSLTQQWKIGFNSWYDLTDGRFTNFGVNIYRDLHCWEMRLNWIPFGFQESYNFQINVKSSILQDLKLIKKKDFYDN